MKISDVFHLLAFNMFKKKNLDFLELAATAVEVRFDVRAGHTAKQMESFIRKIVGKNLEYVITNLDGHYKLPNRMMGSPSNSKELTTKALEHGGWTNYVVVVGKGATFARKLMKEGKGEYWVHKDGWSLGIAEAGENLLNQYREFFLSEVYPDYAKKSGVHLVKIPKDCPGCGNTFGEEVYVEDGDYPHEVEIEDGCCDLCGHLIYSTENVDIPKIYKQIREFEVEKGVRIFPKAA